MRLQEDPLTFDDLCLADDHESAREDIDKWAGKTHTVGTESNRYSKTPPKEIEGQSHLQCFDTLFIREVWGVHTLFAREVWEGGVVIHTLGQQETTTLFTRADSNSYESVLFVRDPF